MTASPLLYSFDSVFDTHLEQCANCNCTFTLASLVETANSRRVCQQCLKEKYAQCNWTSDWYLASDLIKTLPVRFWHLSQQLCDSLDFQRGERRLDVCRAVIDEYFVCCSHCGGYGHQDDTSTTNLNSDTCASCYSLHHFTCDSCSEVYHTDDYGSNGECESCESRREPDDSDSPDDYCHLVHSSGTNVLDYLTFQGQQCDRIYFGVELETQSSSASVLKDNAATCALLLEDFAILKADSSVDCGFEIVTAPATLEIQRERWSKFLDTRPSDLTSYESGACGMHVHVSRSPLSQLSIGKMLVLVNSEKNLAFITKIAGRSSDLYAAIKPDKKICDCRIPYNAQARYEAINLSNPNTIEFRIFRGTLYKLHFLANLEFIHAVVYYCQLCSMQQLHYQNFIRWVQNQPKSHYPNLIEFLQSEGY